MKKLIGLVLLLAPWAIFALIALNRNATSTFALLLTLAVSAFGLTMLLNRPPRR